MSEKSLKIARLMSDAVLGIISPADQEELDKWLAGSEKYRKLYEHLKTAEVYRDKEVLYSRFDRYYDPGRLKKKIRRRRTFRMQVGKYAGDDCFSAYIYYSSGSVGAEGG